ncbi:MAG: hypothetical protein KGY51_00110 [Psychroflexus sp.]|nr:hypothetical protein [Psychroflexus sp.]
MSPLKYYPPLSDVVSAQDLPDILSFIKEGIQSIFDDIYYKDLQYSKSVRGDAAFYSLDIVSRKRLSIEFPGTGIFLVLNPDQQNFNISSFPITVFWEWKILRYKRFFDLNNFSFSIEDFFNLSISVFEVSEIQIIDNAIRTFVVPQSSTTSRIEQFVNDVNTLYGTSISVPVNPETELEDLVYDINQQAGDTAYLSVLSLYILTGDITEQKEKLNILFSTYIPHDIGEYIRDLLIPNAKATLELSVGLEFPRNMLKPVYDESGINPFDSSDTGTPLEVIPEADDDGNPKVILSFGEALFYADTEKDLVIIWSWY